MSIEVDLRELFAADAAVAPASTGLADGARRKARHRVRVQRLAMLGAVVVIGAIAVAVPRLDSTLSPAPAKAAAGAVPVGMAGRPLPGGGSASCVRGYSPQAIARYADFAFDGTVTGIGTSISNRNDAGDLLDLTGVTLHVNEWFKGGTTSTVVVDMPSPSNATSGEDTDGAPAYAVGTRMLVSGAARWGGPDPLKAAIAWWGCGGFTRYYSPDIAATWAAALR